MTKREWKIVAATLIVVGTIFTIFGKIFGPDDIVWHKAPWYGEVAESIGWALLLVAPLAYVAIDHWEGIRKTADKIMLRLKNR